LKSETFKKLEVFGVVSPSFKEHSFKEPSPNADFTKSITVMKSQIPSQKAEFAKWSNTPTVSVNNPHSVFYFTGSPGLPRTVSQPQLYVAHTRQGQTSAVIRLRSDG